MLLSDKMRTLRETEGQLRGLGRALTQGELVKAIREETDKALSQSYLSQIESGARPHLTNTTRLLLASFFKVHPGYLVDDPEGYHAELLSDLRAEATLDAKLDAWLLGGAERFRRDPELHNALITLAMHPESRACLLLLEGLLETPGLAGQLAGLLRPELQHSLGEGATPSTGRSTKHAAFHPLTETELREAAFPSETTSSAGTAVASVPAASKRKSNGVPRRATLSENPGAPHAR